MLFKHVFLTKRFKKFIGPHYCNFLIFFFIGFYYLMLAILFWDQTICSSETVKDLTLTVEDQKTATQALETLKDQQATEISKLGGEVESFNVSK